MRKTCLGVLAAALTVLPALGQTYGLGVTAPSPDSVVLKIDGRNQTFTLGTEAKTPAAEAFLTCLINDRIIKVERKGGAAKLFMLDNSNVADLLREFLQSNTSMDPCAVGKAAYTPKPPMLKGETQQTAVAAAPEPTPAPAQPAATAPKKKLGRKAVAADRGTGKARANEKVLGTSMPLPPPPNQTPYQPPTASDARATTLGQAPVETPTTAQTATSLPAGSTAPGIQPGPPTAPVPTSPTYPGLDSGPTPTQPPVAPPPPPTKP